MSLEMKYFVLKPRAKDKHDSHAMASRAAMLTYAAFIKPTDPELAQDLQEWAKRERERYYDMVIDIHPKKETKKKKQPPRPELEKPEDMPLPLRYGNGLLP